MARSRPLADLTVIRAAREGDGRAPEDLLRALADELMPLAAALAGGSGEALPGGGSPVADVVIF